MPAHPFFTPARTHPRRVCPRYMPCAAGRTRPRPRGGSRGGIAGGATGSRSRTVQEVGGLRRTGRDAGARAGCGDVVAEHGAAQGTAGVHDEHPPQSRLLEGLAHLGAPASRSAALRTGRAALLYVATVLHHQVQTVVERQTKKQGHCIMVLQIDCRYCSEECILFKQGCALTSGLLSNALIVEIFPEKAFFPPKFRKFRLGSTTLILFCVGSVATSNPARSQRSVIGVCT